MYDVNYFIAKFEAIPEYNWWMGYYYNTDRTKFCALGHCKYFISDSRGEGTDLAEIVLNNLLLSVAQINDGAITEYQQPTPKQRILAALYDIRDKELSEANVKEATIIVNTELEVILNYPNV